MAEQNKTDTSNSIVKPASRVPGLVLGFLLVIVGLTFVFIWWEDLWSVFRGMIGVLLVLAGALAFALSTNK